MKSIVLGCISENANEEFILQCVSDEVSTSAAEHLAENIRNDLLKHLSYTGLEFGLVFDGDLAKTADYLQLFGIYLQKINKILSKCDRVAQSFREYFKNNSEFIETVLNFIKRLSAVGTATSISLRSNWCDVKSNFASKLCAFLFDLHEPSFCVETMKRIQYEQITSVCYDRCIISNVIKLIVLQPVS